MIDLRDEWEECNECAPSIIASSCDNFASQWSGYDLVASSDGVIRLSRCIEDTYFLCNKEWRKREQRIKLVEGTRYLLLCITSRKFEIKFCFSHSLDSTAVSIFIVKLVELTNAVFVNSTNIETAVLSMFHFSNCVLLQNPGSLRCRGMFAFNNTSWQNSNICCYHYISFSVYYTGYGKCWEMEFGKYESGSPHYASSSSIQKSTEMIVTN